MSRSAEQSMPQAVPGNSRLRHEAGALRKALGFAASAGLVTTALWWVSLGETAEPVRARAGNASPSNSAGRGAQQLYSEGRMHYLAGRYAEALAALQAAEPLEADLAAADRERFHQLLERTRAKTGSAGGQDVVARGQSADAMTEPGAAPGYPAAADSLSADASEKQRNDAAKKLLAEARQKFNAGKLAEAEKLARDCQTLGIRWKKFGPSPEKLIEEIKE